MGCSYHKGNNCGIKNHLRSPIIMKRKLIPLLYFSMHVCLLYAQDTLDSITRVHIVTQVDECSIAQFVDSFRGGYVWSPQLQKMADEGNPAALNAVGSCYQNASGLKKDVDLAFDYFMRAAEAGNHKALNNLGNCYEKGIGVEKDERQAFLFYKKAALKGHEIAMINLAQCYMRGTGTEVDDYKARAWFEKTAKSRGDRVSVVNTGFLYYQIGDDYKKAFEYLTKGSKMGSPSATLWLAMCYRNGQGCPQDISKSIELFKKVLNMPERLTDEEYDHINEIIAELEKLL